MQSLFFTVKSSFSSHLNSGWKPCAVFVFTKKQKELIHIQEMQMSGPKPSDFPGGEGEGEEEQGVSEVL